MTDDVRIPLGWEDSTVPLHSYLSFYYAREQTRRRSLAFVRVGLDEAGTFNLILARDSQHPAILEALQDEYGGDVQPLLAAGKLAIVGGAPTVEELADDDGSGLQDLAMVVGSRMQEALASGFRQIRALGFVEWGQPGWPDMEALKRCEAQIQNVAIMFPVVVLCAYQTPDLPGLAGPVTEEPSIVVHERIHLA